MVCTEGGKGRRRRGKEGIKSNGIFKGTCVGCCPISEMLRIPPPFSSCWCPVPLSKNFNVIRLSLSLSLSLGKPQKLLCATVADFNFCMFSNALIRRLFVLYNVHILRHLRVNFLVLDARKFQL